MTQSDISHLRLAALGISRPLGTTPLQITTALGALQAQDFSGALWALGLRLPGSTRRELERTLAKGSIVRTWPMRGTLHIVPAADARWMLGRLTPRVIASTASRFRQLDITEPELERAEALLRQALAGGQKLTRPQVMELLDARGIPTVNQRGINILGRLSQQAVLCHGPRQAKQPTFVLFDDWIKSHNELLPDEQLRQLAKRYFTSHGPATMKDFVGWCGLTVTDARQAVELAGAELAQTTINGTSYFHGPRAAPSAIEGSYLLPGFDEFILGYKDRSAVVPPQYSDRIVPGGNGMFMPTMVQNGQVVGTWRAVSRARTVTVQYMPFEPLDARAQADFKIPAAAYGAFMEQYLSEEWL